MSYNEQTYGGATFYGNPVITPVGEEIHPQNININTLGAKCKLDEDTISAEIVSLNLALKSSLSKFTKLTSKHVSTGIFKWTQSIGSLSYNLLKVEIGRYPISKINSITLNRENLLNSSEIVLNSPSFNPHIRFTPKEYMTGALEINYTVNQQLDDDDIQLIITYASLIYANFSQEELKDFANRNFIPPTSVYL